MFSLIAILPTPFDNSYKHKPILQLKHLLTFSYTSHSVVVLNLEPAVISHLRCDWEQLCEENHLVLCISSKFISLIPSTLTWYPSRDHIRRQLKHIPEFQLETIHSFLFLLDLIPPSISLKRKRESDSRSNFSLQGSEQSSTSPQRGSKDNSSITKKLKSLSLD